VLSLAWADAFRSPVLTDDLTLRRMLEREGATAVGTAGVLVRAYRRGLLARTELDAAVDALFERSTLHVSLAFRAYVRSLLRTLP
jgi:predicted nucleic acid-binding protein